MLISLLIASIPVAPFITPESISISGFPPRTVIDQTFKKAVWLQSDPKTIGGPGFKADEYVGISRRRGNIVTLSTLTRKLFQESPTRNRNSDVSKGFFVPGYSFFLMRFDCANDTLSTERLVSVIDGIGDGPEVKGKFMHPTDSSETNWVVTANQKRVTIEGYPYWALRIPSNDPRSKKRELKWISTLPGTYGASYLDYACDNY